MSHIHLPDGIISPFLWIPAFLITFCIVYYIIKSIKQDEVRHKIPHTGVAAAIMLLGMSVPIFIVPVHLSLAVLTGILIGPKLGFLAVLVVNFILAFIGHGGITLVGINTLIIGSEVVVGFYIFKYVSKHGNYRFGAMIATSMAVIISMTLMVSMVSATAGFEEALPHHHHGEHHHEEVSEERVLKEVIAEQEVSEEKIIEEEVINEKITNEIETEDTDLDHNHMEFHTAVSNIKYFVFTGWTAVTLILFVGILLESIGTTLIVNYFVKVRPGIVSSVQNKNM
ncbi:energy-coupling factor ABC transporter permease [Serpentinicella alkaliphila]|uniref:Cobalt/nickel transport system permease protein n=1 Tax=Serpentinicella alkaliphila TaxID=1734049 RepID=A0A4R2TKY6_9FIRM|nr:energy-coupling factor ABC transporter permease [Serpentinicella alkaliphila]QUH24813.1 energy-coupling factor ABC transporter permease [Serpentinicella alkaliphila]TCQ03486.1 cobalt/nickel transport system permease protein [Serpentinicella alkaliphila]